MAIKTGLASLTVGHCLLSFGDDGQFVVVVVVVVVILVAVVAANLSLAAMTT